MIDLNALNVLNFWFIESNKEQWFKKDNSYDLLIINRYSILHKRAVNGDLNDWKNNPEGSLALIIIIDQFSRNMFRNNQKSFAFDHIALQICKNGLNKFYLDSFFDTAKKMFFILPLLHSENIENQELAIHLAHKEISNHPEFDKTIKFFNRHKEIIEKFGRFPHRNKILNRASTQNEIDFLKTPFSSF